MHFVGMAMVPPLLLPTLEPAACALALAAVTLSAWACGIGPGLFAAALLTLTLDYLFMPPIYSLTVGPEDGIRLAAFVLSAVLISSLNGARGRLKGELIGHQPGRRESLAVLAHELRNFLSAAASALQVLRAQGADRAAVERSQEILERQILNMTRLVNDLLDVTRIDQGKVRLCKELVDLRIVVAQAAETALPAVEARRHQLEVVLPAAPVPVQADVTRLEQVFVNLLTNAARYTEPGGLIWLAMEPAQDKVCVWVRDTGVGLSPEVLVRAFDLFAQAEDGSDGGLGVGLSLARGLVRLHGGELTAWSDGPGRGSEFVVHLPRQGKSAQVGQKEAVAPIRSGRLM
jgi:signal transduction histidine kinase